MYKKDIYLDIDDKLNNYIKSVELDSNSRVLHFHLTVDYSPLDLTGKAVQFRAEKPDKTNVLNDCKIIDAKNGIVKVELTQQVNAVPGHVYCLLKITGSDGYVLKTKTFIIEVSKTLGDEPIVSSNEFRTLDEALEKVRNIDQRFAETNAQMSAIKEHCTGGNGMQEHSHTNKTVLDKLSESEDSLFFDGKEIGGKIDNGSITFNKLSADVFENKDVYSLDITNISNVAIKVVADRDYVVGEAIDVKFTVLSGTKKISNFRIHYGSVFGSDAHTIELDSNGIVEKTLILTTAISKGNLFSVMFANTKTGELLKIGSPCVNNLDIVRISDLTNDNLTSTKYSYFTKELAYKEQIDAFAKDMDSKLGESDVIDGKTDLVVKTGKKATWNAIWTILTIPIPNVEITTSTDITVSFDYVIDKLSFGKLVIYHDFSGDDGEHLLNNSVTINNPKTKINYSFNFTQEQIDAMADNTVIKFTMFQVVNEDVEYRTQLSSFSVNVNGYNYKGILNAYNGNSALSGTQKIEVIRDVYSENKLATGKELNELIENTGSSKNIEKPSGINIVCAGDSLTVGYNGVANNSYVDYVKSYFPLCNIHNKGSNGGGAGRLINILTPYKREGGVAYTGGSDFLGTLESVDCVVINIGTNDFTSGNFDTDIPKFNFTTIENALNGGFEHNGEQIDTLEKYWGLFANTWYGNLAMLIEYIQWKYPMCQILLTPPTSNAWLSESDGRNPHTMKVKMDKIADLYGIKVIDVIQGLGINVRNNHLWRGDLCHGNDIRNEKVGRYLAKQIFNELLV